MLRLTNIRYTYMITLQIQTSAYATRTGSRTGWVVMNNNRMPLVEVWDYIVKHVEKGMELKESDSRVVLALNVVGQRKFAPHWYTRKRYVRFYWRKDLT